MGVYFGALTKKQQYWPKNVPGNLIDKYFKEKYVGDTDSLLGTLNGVKYDLFYATENNYIMKIMSTYDGLTVKEGQSDSKQVNTKIGE